MTRPSPLQDLGTLLRLIGPPRGGDHRQRLERFYGPQAEQYDSFRSRLLKGRETLISQLHFPRDAVVVDLGGGTGSNLELVDNAQLRQIKLWYIVDLSTSLLRVARDRMRREGWANVRTVEADACTWRPAAGDGRVDVVLFSYSLTMIPDWMAALENARTMLRPGGAIGVVDFYVNPKFPRPGRARHGAFTRHFWPTWFAWDNVFLSGDHLTYLERRFSTAKITEQTGALPYLPFARVPYYTFVGHKPNDAPYESLAITVREPSVRTTTASLE